MIKWLANKLLPYLMTLIQKDEGVVQVCKRIDRLEKDSHPPLFSKDQLFKVHSRLEALETKAFVDKVTKYDWQGSD